MEKKVTTGKIVDVYTLLSDAKYTKMEDENKVCMFKIFKSIRPIGETFNKDLQDARDTLIPYDNYKEDYAKAVRYEIAKQKKESFDEMTDKEYKKFIEEMVKYKELVNKALLEILNKEVTIEIEPLSPSGIDQLLASNDWTFKQCELVESLICE